MSFSALPLTFLSVAKRRRFVGQESKKQGMSGKPDQKNRIQKVRIPSGRF